MPTPPRLTWHQGALRTTQTPSGFAGAGGCPGGGGGTGAVPVIMQTATLFAQACALHGRQETDSPLALAYARHSQPEAGSVQL
jgi:hypothetical protein